MSFPFGHRIPLNGAHLLAFQNGLINFPCYRSADFGAGTAGLGLDHDYNGIARFIKRREAYEPGNMFFQLVADIFSLSSSGFPTNRKTLDGGSFAGSVRIFDISPHRLAHEFQSARSHAKFVANPSALKSDRRIGRGRIL